MLRNYFIIALRNLWRNQAFQAINLLGLSVGMASVIFMLLYVRHELSYDRHHPRADRIYRIVQEQHFANGIQQLATTNGRLAPALVREFPEVEQATRLHVRRNTRLTAGQQAIGGQTVAYVDANFFRVFHFHFLEGNPATALLRPYSLILTQRTARKFFADGKAVGQTLQLNQGSPFLITGVVQDPPVQSHFHFDGLASFSTFDPSLSWIQQVNSLYTYVLLGPETNAENFEQKLPPFAGRFHGGDQVRFHPQALRDIHLSSKLVEEIEPNGNATSVYAFLGIALLTLLLACVNHVILTTALHARRLKEVGLRKTLGAHRSQLAIQFWLESTTFTSVAFLLAVVWILLGLPFFNQLTHLSLTLKNLAGWPELRAWAMLPWVVSSGACVYPAWYVSRLPPVAVLKGTLHLGHDKLGLRNSLIVFQFAISVALMVATVVVYQQMAYVQSKDLGFNRQFLLNIPVRSQPNRTAKMNLLKQELQRSPRIASASSSLYAVGEAMETSDVRPARAPSQETRILRILFVDYDYFQTLQLPMVAGRAFSRKFVSDTTHAFIINQAAVRAFGWHSPQEALGKELEYGGGERFSEPVVGVVKDFHFASLHQPIEPLLIMCWPSRTATLHLRFRPGNLSQALADLATSWRKVFPDEALDYTFVDQFLARLYQNDEQTRSLLLVFSGLAVGIACLGLLGLTMFSCQQRTREIGIRKVLGASINDLVRLLTKDYLQLVLVAILAAVPLAWLAANRWLESFHYRISLSGWVFVIGGGGALLLALLTVSYQAFRAASANPIESLRSE